MPTKPPSTSSSSDVKPTAATLPPSPPPFPATRLSLPAVERLLVTLRLLRAGKLEAESDWLTFALSSAEYTDFETRLRQDEKLSGWYEDKARYDWAPGQDEQGGSGSRGEYILRVPNALHERFISDVEDAIVAGIRELAERLVSEGDGHDDDREAGARKKVAAELKKVRKGRSTTVEMRPPRLESSSQASTLEREEEKEGGEEVVVRRSPDATFYHPSQPDLPCMVVEVSCNRQRKQLPRLAESHIVDSQHAIRCVVGLDITSPSPPRKKRKMADGKLEQTASLSVWRPGVERGEDGEEVGTCRTHVDAVLVRDAHGHTSDGALTLQLADLLPPSLVVDLPPSAAEQNINILFSTISTCLTSAQHSTSATPSQTSSAPEKLRPRKRTPSKKLSGGREAAAEKDRKTTRERRAPSRRSAGDACQQEAGVERRRSTRRRTSGRAIGTDS